MNLPMVEPTSQEEGQAAQLAAELAALNAGVVRFSAHERMLYATDASIYQVEPVGVVVPNGVDDIPRVLACCAARGVAVLPRGGGTSLAGQCVNRAVVIDHSANCRRPISVDGAARTVLVEPGVVLDDLNRWLATQPAGAGRGLFYAPDPATSAQATIGGCIGNNAAGARSIRYGRTVENVDGLEVALSGGQRLWLERGAGRPDRRNPAARKLAEDVIGVVREYEPLIRQRFPKTNRRSAGYALDLILKQLDEGVSAEDLDLSPLICGSEGTLAIVLRARLKLHPLPASKGLAILSYATVKDAIDAVVDILKTGPSAVELLDDVVLEAARGNVECRRYMDLVPPVNGRAPNGVLYVEYQEVGPMADVHARFEKLKSAAGTDATRFYDDAASQARAWALRKAGEPLLHGLAGHRKPVTCVEDNAVPVENLARFVEAFRRIVEKHGTKAAYYAHASVGVLHVRPLLDLHDPADRDRLRAIAVEVADLARECGGVMSGEHGDGRIRGPLLERYFGAELMRAFAKVKAIFDPAGILNPGIIVNPGSIASITENLRVRPGGREIRVAGGNTDRSAGSSATGNSSPERASGGEGTGGQAGRGRESSATVDTYFDYTDQEGFGGAVEMCNGAGVCRRSAPGVICPSYRATADERHSTRGRGNALRLALSGQLPRSNGSPWNDADTIATLDLCLSCKACKSECPSNVDVARLKAEYTAQRYREQKPPLKAKMFSRIRQLNRLGSLAPGVANFVANLPPIRAMMNKLLNLSPRRTLPPFARSLYRWFNRRDGVPAPAGAARVGLYADCFTTYNEPSIGMAAVAVLETLGYGVDLPKVGCCGRSMISNGLLDEAIASADRTLERLRPFIEDDNVRAIIVCEPSCLATMKDEWLSLKLATPRALRQKLADKAMLLEEFIERYWTEHPVAPRPAQTSDRPVALHGHCHQKALWGDGTTSAVLRRLVGQRLTVLPSGCCGMAGAFGYTKDHYELSMKIGQQSLFDLLEEIPPDALVLAAGTSCRHQIKDGTGRRAEHPAEFLARMLGAGK